MTYIAAEPIETTSYVDQTGKIHSSRENAIDANFKDDLFQKCKALVEDYSLSPVYFQDLLAKFIEFNPDMVRVMLGDRDAT